MSSKQPRTSKPRLRDKVKTHHDQDAPENRVLEHRVPEKRSLRHRMSKRVMRKRKKKYDLTSMLPNLVTLLGLCAGLSALRFAWMDRFDLAIVAVILAAFFDTMDGALARMLNASSRFGAELDSLADFATFGIVPALIMYMVSLKFYGSLGWVFVLWFAVCGSLRLARFNAHSIDDDGTGAPWKQGFFTGTPIPFSALLCMGPLIINLAWPEQTLSLNPIIVGVWMALVGFCMISHIPTFSLKKIELSSKMLLPLVIGIVVGVSAILSHPWKTLSVILVGYLVSIPLSVRRYRMLSKSEGGADI